MEADLAIVSGPAPDVPYGGRYPADYTISSHTHERDQLLYGKSGMMTVNTTDGAWLLPPERAVWIPAGTAHSVRMVGPVTTRSLFTNKEFRVRRSARCEVVSVSPLLHSLLLTAYDMRLAPDNVRKKLLLLMLLVEVRTAPVEPLSLAIPAAKALAAKCQAYLANPSPHETIDSWCAELGMSRRAFTRLFRKETGQSFAAWRQQACLFAALPRLAAGDSVTDVAFSLGYSSQAAFTSMFRRVLGTTPRHYFGNTRTIPTPPDPFVHAP